MSPNEVLRLKYPRPSHYQEALPDPLRLPFNGELSADERRMMKQGIGDGPFSWEVQ